MLKKFRASRKKNLTFSKIFNYLYIEALEFFVPSQKLKLGHDIHFIYCFACYAYRVVDYHKQIIIFQKLILLSITIMYLKVHSRFCFYQWRFFQDTVDSRYSHPKNPLYLEFSTLFTIILGVNSQISIRFLKNKN